MNRISRLCSLLITAVLVFLCLSGTLAANAAEAPRPVISGELAAAYEQNPVTDAELDDESRDALCLKIYGYIAPEKAEKVFYGGPKDAAELITKLNSILRPEEPCTDTGLYNAAYFYALVWEALHWNVPAEKKTRAAVKTVMKGAFYDCSDFIAGRAVKECFDYIGKHEPDLTAGADSEPETTEGPDEYRYYFDMGEQLFEEGDYPAAIGLYRRCLEVEKRDPEATFRIVDAYIAMKDYNVATYWLTTAYRLAKDDAAKARWMRSRGAVLAGEEDYQLAYAYYLYSTTVEESEEAAQAMADILSAAPETVQFTAEEALAYIQEHGI